MKRIGFVFACLGIVLGLAAVTPVHATNFHSFVSANGSGTACTFSAPCNTFTAAIAVTSSDGVITCVDQGANSAGSNAIFFVVDRSITIDCGGTAPVAFNVVVNSPGIIVTLRNLQINSLSAASNSSGIGVDFQNGSALFIEHCVIDGWNGGVGAGIRFAPPSGTAELHVTDSVIKNSGNGSSGGGIIIQPSGSGSAHVVIENTKVENNTYGIFANGTGTTGSILLHIKDSTVANSTVNGISAYTAGSIAAIVIDHSSSLINGGSGILAQGSGGLVFLTDTTVMSNVTGLSTAGGGTIYSYGNNRLTGNASDGVTPVTSGFALK